MTVLETGALENKDMETATDLLVYVAPDGDEYSISQANRVIAVSGDSESACRLAALWQAAGEMRFTTDDVKNRCIQRTCEVVESHAKVIEAALERIEQLESQKMKMLEALKRGRKFIFDSVVAGSPSNEEPEAESRVIDILEMIEEAIGKAKDD